MYNIYICIIYIYIYISVEKMNKRCYRHQTLLLNKKDSQGFISNT